MENETAHDWKVYFDNNPNYQIYFGTEQGIRFDLEGDGYRIVKVNIEEKEIYID